MYNLQENQTRNVICLKVWNSLLISDLTERIRLDDHFCHNHTLIALRFEYGISSNIIREELYLYIFQKVPHLIDH
jgi:hypothetical protein